MLKLGGTIVNGIDGDTFFVLLICATVITVVDVDDS